LSAEKALTLLPTMLRRMRTHPVTH
jgi:hypothetical protein